MYIKIIWKNYIHIHLTIAISSDNKDDGGRIDFFIFFKIFKRKIISLNLFSNNFVFFELNLIDAVFEFKI